MSALPNNPKQALENFINEIHDEYELWYKSSVRRIHATWLVLHMTSLLAGFASAVLAALASDAAIKEFGVIRLLLIVLPAVGAASTTVVVQSRLQEWCRLREEGRLAMQSLYNEAKTLFASAPDNAAAHTAIHEELNRQVRAIETRQGAGWVLLSTRPPTAP